MEDKLLAMMFEYDRWVDLLEHAEEKGINKTILRKMSSPQVRLELYNRIKSGRYEIRPPRVLLIPKDDGTMRKVYANEDEDRIICTLVNDCMMELFKEYIHPSCVSYQKGTGCQEIVQKVSREVVKLGKNTNEHIGYVSDFSKYFDNVSIEAIDECFDKMETKLGFEVGTEPVIEMMRKYYHNELYFDENGDLQSKFQSLKQGCAVAAMLSCMVLYELDEYMSKTSLVYYRYSDDCLTLREDTSEIVNDINNITSKYGVTLNSKKVKPVYADQFFKFLGFKIRGNQITLSKNRVKKLQKEIVSRTLNKPNITERQAKQNVLKFLYGNADGYSWATACLGTINIENDLIEIDNFIKDCLRACKIRESKKRKSKISIADIGGLGSVDNLSDRTILRGKGRRVRTYRDRTDKTIQNYKTMNCLSKAYKLGKPIYEATVRGI